MIIVTTVLPSFSANGAKEVFKDGKSWSVNMEQDCIIYNARTEIIGQFAKGEWKNVRVDAS